VRYWDGDLFWIKKVGHLYSIGYNNGYDDCPLYWSADPGRTKNAQFRCGDPINDLFYIKAQPNGWWAIGFEDKAQPNGWWVIGSEDCPLFWEGSDNNVKDAEFRCGQPISDTFWIKGADCKLANVQISDTAGEPKFDGEEIVGVTTAASCSGGEHNLVLEHLKEITDEVALRTTESTMSNWRETETVTVKGSVKFLGTGGSVSAQVSSSFGGAVTWESSRKQITESATTVESRVKISYKTPGAAMIVGFVKRYVFENSEVPAKATVTCAGGHSYQYNTIFSLETKTYSQTFFKHYRAEYLPGQCTEDRANCV
jgi:hypothetical protein